MEKSLDLFIGAEVQVLEEFTDAIPGWNSKMAKTVKQIGIVCKIGVIDKTA